MLSAQIKTVKDQSGIDEIFIADIDLLFDAILKAIKKVESENKIEIEFKINTDFTNNYHRRAFSILNKNGKGIVSIGLDIFTLISFGVKDVDSEMLSKNYDELKDAAKLPSEQVWIFEKIIFITSLYLIVWHELSHILFKHHLLDKKNYEKSKLELEADNNAAKEIKEIVNNMLERYKNTINIEGFHSTFFFFIAELACLYSLWKCNDVIIKNLYTPSPSCERERYPDIRDRIICVTGRFVLNDLENFILSSQPMSIFQSTCFANKHMKNFFTIFNRFNKFSGADWEDEAFYAKKVLQDMVDTLKI